MAERIVVKVPGSTSNLGPGFDSIGLAVNRFLTVEAVIADQWQFASNLEGIPLDKTNLIYQVAADVAKLYGQSLPPLALTISSDIPPARGLGSSAAAVVAGIEVADVFAGLNLDRQSKLNMAANIEGHPDNVAPSLYGGLVIAHQPLEGETTVVPIAPSDVDLVAFIPERLLETKTARSVLPDTLKHSTAVKGSSAANLFVAAALQGDWVTAGRMMDEDTLHQPYRKALIPEMDQVMADANAFGAYGTALSGAGPTMLVFCPVNVSGRFVTHLRKQYPDHHLEQLKIVQSGVHVEPRATLDPVKSL
ncbi:homoserine kinase [Tuberibacillus sp. Marseille-P3662]|uniref:homoserine kinase n=1 Tax=Tuberibacillus sp. Marseille-P3662 TaxID=1965358 RepID=UPI000A1C81B6|nr:homoserine kinase [Tuberibacillus sp. Marseille-P3662]